MGGVQGVSQGFGKAFGGAIAIAMATVFGFPWPDWEHESKCTVADLALVPVFAVIFPTVRFLLDALIFEVVASSLFLSLRVCVCVRIKRPSFARVLRFPFDQILVADREMLLSVGLKHTKAYKNIRDT